MKNLKRFENFDFGEEDFDDEEFDDTIRVNDEVVSKDGTIEYWSEKQKKFVRIYRYGSGDKLVVGEIKHSSNVKSDSHGDIENIPYNGYLIRGKHKDGRLYLVWIKMDDLVKV